MSAYIDSELAGVEQLAIRDHLRSCHSCNEEYESLLAMKRRLTGLGMRGPRLNLEEAILQRIAAEKSNNSFSVMFTNRWSIMDYRQRVRFTGSVAAGAVCLLALVVIQTNRIQSANSISNLPTVTARKLNTPIFEPTTEEPVTSVASEMVFIHNPNEFPPAVNVSSTHRSVTYLPGNR